MLAIAREVKLALDVDDHDTAARALQHLAIACEAVTLDLAAAILRAKHDTASATH
jgi:hypothetical protein